MKLITALITIALSAAAQENKLLQWKQDDGR